jgi:hypothetical protein
VRALLLVALLAGCAGTPVAPGAALACVRVDALTTQTTSVYVATGVTGSFIVQPDCSIAAQFDAPAPTW